MHILFSLLIGFLFISCTPQNTPLDQIADNLIISKSTKFLKINPYGNAPLSAELHLSPSKDSLTITVKGQDDSDISYTWDNSTNTVFPILGLYFDYTNTVIISTPSLEKQIQIVITNTVPKIIKSITVLSNQRIDSPERANFLDFFNPVGTLTDLFATDNYGKIRWYLQSKDELHGMKFTTQDGEVIFSILNTVKPEVLTFNMLGKKINTIQGPKTHRYTIPEADKRFHHDMFSRSNGNILVLDKSQYGVEDTILELDPKGKIIQEIRIGDWIRKTVNNDPKDNTGLEKFIFDSEENPFDEFKSEIRYPGMPPNQNAIDWAHINAFSFDEAKEIIYFSFRQHGIFAFDYKTQLLKWIFIRDDYVLPTENLIFYNLPEEIDYVYNIPALKPYILKGAKGPDHPHALTFLSNNTFMVFDNSGNDGLSPQEGSRLLVFTVNEETMTASIKWEYRHQDTNNTLVYSQIVSDMDQTPFGSYVGVFGTRVPFTYIEVDQQKKLLFDLRLELIHQGAGESDISLPIACPTSRLIQNGVFVYRADYNAIYPSVYRSID
ncbi:MAG: aryl-sulfate sulfotransferase [Brevinema sp.]